MRPALIIIVLALLSPASWAGVYKCTQPDGTVTYNQSPCPEGGDALKLRTGTASPQAPDNDGDQLREHLRRFNAQENITGATARINLGEPVNRLLQIQEETRGVDTRACRTKAKQELINYMDRVIEGYRAFMLEDDDGLYRQTLHAEHEMLRFRVAIQEPCPSEPTD